MIHVPTILSELLFDCDAVIVPGLGMFMRHDDSAKVNVITNHFERPSASISFDPKQREENDFLAKAMMAHEGCSLEEAQQAVARFVSDCFEALKEQGTVSLPGIGTLSMYANQTLSFVQERASNFNGDAFGLGDFNPRPVHDIPSNDWKAKVIQQNKDKNTPITSGTSHRARRAVVLSVLLLLLVVPAVLLLLHFLEVIQLNFLFPPKPVTPVTVSVPRDTTLSPYMVCYYPINDTIIADTAEVSDSTMTELTEPLAVELSDSVVEPSEPVKVEPEAVAVSTEVPVQDPVSDKPLRYRIIGGCFTQPENAENLVSSLHAEGYEKAEVMRQGKQFFVCYGRFATLEEAKAALSEIRLNSNSKAWILNK